MLLDCLNVRLHTFHTSSVNTQERLFAHHHTSEHFLVQSLLGCEMMMTKPSAARCSLELVCVVCDHCIHPVL